MNVILENYLVIVLVGLFFVFALIGYLIDMLRKSNNVSKEETNNDIKPIEIAKINENLEQSIETPLKKETNNTKDNADELLENYDKETNEKM